MGIHAQIDDTVSVMRENITKVAERGERLDSLQDRTGKYSLLFPISAHILVPCAGDEPGSMFTVSANPIYRILTGPLDDLAVSGRGFRRGADKVRKVCV